MRAQCWPKCAIQFQASPSLHFNKTKQQFIRYILPLFFHIISPKEISSPSLPLFAFFADFNGPFSSISFLPILGIKMFEVVQSQRRPETWQITGAMDELSKCEIKSHSNIWRKMLSACGFVFASEWWSVQSDGFRVAQAKRGRILPPLFGMEYQNDLIGAKTMIGINWGK